MAAILLAGLAAYPLLPVAPLPRVDFPTIQITAQYPGADPGTIAATLASPLEQQLGQISGVTQMTSISVTGGTQIVLQFDLDRNIDGAALDVVAGINAAAGSLPKNLPSPPTYRKVNPADSPILILAVQSDTLPIIDVDDAAENVLAQQMSQITGVSQVVIGGQQKPSVRVQIDPARLAAMGMTLEDVRAMLINATGDNPKGSVETPRQSFSILDNDQMTKAAEYKDRVLTYRNGAPIRLSDIGTVLDAPENVKLAGWQNGRRGIQLVVFKQPGANVIDTVDHIKAALPQLRAAISPAINITEVMDRTQTIRA
jgi:multidrug efflux pump subunit AcrB